MKVKELIAKLQEFDGEFEVKIDDEDGYDYPIKYVTKYDSFKEIVIGFN